MSDTCPNCQRLLYDRRLKACGFCGAAIPGALRFTPEEIAVLDRQMAEMEKQRRRRKKLAEKEVEEARQRASGDPGISFASFLS